jgi:hypothetical protein
LYKGVVQNGKIRQNSEPPCEVGSKGGLFVEILGNPYPEELDIESLTKYKNLLRNLPSNALKNEKYCKKILQ